jgi:hypothetical protein
MKLKNYISEALKQGKNYVVAIVVIKQATKTRDLKQSF